MKPKNYRQFFKASTIAVVLGVVALLITFSCEENGADEKPMNGNSTANVVETKTSASTVTSTKFHERVGAQIPLDVAKRWKANYMKEHPGGFESHFFGSIAFEKLLNQPNVVGISIEYALNDEGIPQLLIVGVDRNGRKMVGEGESGYEDVSNLCPPDCSKID
jgi:hypothetical protein